MIKRKTVAVVGTGPSGLMVAFLASRAGWDVDLFDKNAGIGRKILIAGSSGFNVGNNLSKADFLSYVEHDGDKSYWENHIDQFFTEDWLNFLLGLGIETFLGSSQKYFSKDMHAAQFLKTMQSTLKEYGVNFLSEKKLTDMISKDKKTWTLIFNNVEEYGPYEFVSLNLGGGSWESEEVTWPSLLEKWGCKFIPFQPANVGFHIKEWTHALVRECHLKPIKDCMLTTSKGKKRGDLLVTSYGLEGTPMYFVGHPGPAEIDFFPSYSLEALKNILKKSYHQEKLHNLRKIKKKFPSQFVLQALLYHSSKNINDLNNEDLAFLLKHYNLTLESPRPLTEAISSYGGISMKEVDENFMCRKIPGVFLSGEMLNWSAPTGGFLIQTCITQGYIVGKFLAMKVP